MIPEHNNHGRFIHLTEITGQIFKCLIRFVNQRNIGLCQFVILHAVDGDGILHRSVGRIVSAVILHRHVKNKQVLIFVKMVDVVDYFIEVAFIGNKFP